MTKCLIFFTRKVGEVGMKQKYCVQACSDCDLTLDECRQVCGIKQSEIVRCKDYQFMYVSECDPNKEMWCCARHHILATVQPDFFCADGVRRE